MNQHEITERRPLLDASGNLTEPGYAKTLLPMGVVAAAGLPPRGRPRRKAPHQGVGLLLRQQRALCPRPDHRG